MTHPAYRGPWLKLRLAILQRDSYECQLRLPGCKGTATAVDHIVGIEQGGPWWDPTNCRASCKSCNTAKGNTTNNPKRWGRTTYAPSRQW